MHKCGWKHYLKKQIHMHDKSLDQEKGLAEKITQSEENIIIIMHPKDNAVMIYDHFLIMHAWEKYTQY